MAESQKLLALGVFKDTHKAEYVRSIHMYDRNGMMVTTQQEFLLTPGLYSRISPPVPCGYFYSAASSSPSPANVKSAMVAIKKMLEGDRWKCVLEFLKHWPHEIIILDPLLLIPSRNEKLNSIPSLAQDLVLVEAAYNNSSNLNSSPSIFVPDHINSTSISISITSLRVPNINELDTCQGASSDIPRLSFFSGEPLNDQIPGLETPDRTPQGAQADIWQKWGSDLELASPRVNYQELGSWRINYPDSTQVPLNSTSPSAADPPPPWSPSLLDLNLHLPDFLSESREANTSLLLSSSFEPATGLNLELATSLSLQNSTITRAEAKDQGQDDTTGIDCFSLDCFGLDSSSSNFYSGEITNHVARSLCSDDSIGTGQVLGLRSTSEFSSHDVAYDMNGVFNTDKANSSTTTSSDVHWGGGGKGVKLSSGDPYQLESPATSTGYTSWRGGREGRVTRRGRQTEKSIYLQQKGTSERITEITLQELSQYFNMPITQASKELKVGLTVLKKRCREFGIPRWPHRKMKSLDSLINNIQDLARDQGVKSSARVLNAVKELEEQKRLMEECPGTELAERTKRLRQACFKASYKKRRLQAQIQQAQGNNMNPNPNHNNNHAFLLNHLNPTPTSSIDTEHDLVCPKL